MENQKKNNTALIVVIVLVCIFLFFALIGFGGYYAYKNIIEPKISDTVKKGTTTTTDTKNIDNSKKSSTTSSSKDAKVADKTSPVKVGQWALASKYAGRYLDESYADQTYIDVPVRVTKISRGNSLSSEVKDLLASKHYKIKCV